MLCIASSIIIYLNKTTERKPTFMLGLLQIMNAVLITADAFSWFFRGDTTPFGGLMVRLSNAIVFIWEDVAILTFGLFFYFCVPEKNRSRFKPIMFIVSIICFLAIVSIIVSQFTDIYYYFDENNLYHRNDKYYWILVAAGVLCLFLYLIAAIAERKSVTRTIAAYLAIYISIPLIALVIQFFIYGISILNIATLIASLLVFVVFEISQEKENYKKMKELRILENDILSAQIKPHFIFNMLSSIKYVYHDDPEKGDYAIDELANYFRGYISCIDSEKLIFFQEELSNTKSFINLEKIRYGEKIHTVFDIREKEFLVPPFILQPLVENAIKHGLNTREEGGTITISSFKDEDNYIITILNDGSAYNPESLDDGRKHVGIDNVRSRLQIHVNGTFGIIAASNNETLVTIKIPIKDQKNLVV